MRRFVSSQSLCNNRNKLRNNLVRALRTAFCLTVLPALFASSAQAQMRTSRGTRDLYDAEEKVETEQATTKRSSSNTETKAAKPVRASGRGKSVHQDSQVQQASAEGSPNPVANRASKTSKVNAPSQVTQASCENCDKGIAEPIPMNDSVVMESGCDSCGGCGCDSCDPCDPGLGGQRQFYIDLGCGPLANTVSWISEHTYMSAQAATFYQKGTDLPALVSNGGLTVFGNDEVNTDAIVGYRGTLGVWLDPNRERALQLRVYDAGTWATNFARDETDVVGNTILGRPYRDDNGAAVVDQTLAIVSRADNVLQGSVTANVLSKASGGDVLLRKRLLQNRNVRWDLLVGYQHNRVNEDLLIHSVTTSFDAGGRTLQVIDHFAALNRFDGMALGLQRFSRFGRSWSLDTSFKLGFGNMRHEVQIDGSRQITTFVPAGQTAENQGLLARRTNAGNYLDNTFVVSPEFSLTLGYRVTRNMDASVGYSYLSLPKVARVGDQIDVNSNIDGVGVSAPNFNLRESNYILQSFNFGAQFRF